MKIEVRGLTIKDQGAFQAAINSFKNPVFEFAHYWESIPNKDFYLFLEALEHFEQGEILPENHVPSTQLYAFNEKGVIMGRSSVRHRLNDHLLKVGGHIGYIVLPQFRKKGVGKELLKQSLSYMKNNLNFQDKVLVTCDENNVASRKIVLSQNAVLENQISQGEGQPLKNRYWIAL